MTLDEYIKSVGYNEDEAFFVRKGWKAALDNANKHSSIKEGDIVKDVSGVIGPKGAVYELGPDVSTQNTEEK